MKDRRLRSWLVYNYDVTLVVRRLVARVVAIKCCTVPCQRISFARLYSGRTLFPFS